MKKWNMLSKIEKGSIVCIGAVVLFGSGLGGYKAYADRQKQQDENEAKEVVIGNRSMLEEKGKINSEIISLVDDKGFLKKGISQQEISNAIDELEMSYEAVNSAEKKMKDKKELFASYASVYNSNKEMIDTIQKKFSIQQSINEMFESKDNKLVIDGSEVNKELSIVKTIDDKKIESCQKDLTTIANDDWKSAISSLIEIVKTQKEQMSEATNLVNGLFDKEKPKADVSKENYDKAKSAVDKVKNEEVKKELNVKLDKVKQVLDEREKKEEQEKQAQKENTTEPLANPNVTVESTNEEVVDQGQGSVQTNENVVADTNTDGYSDSYSAQTTAPQYSSGQSASSGSTQSSTNSDEQAWQENMQSQFSTGTQYGSYEEAQKAADEYVQNNEGSSGGYAIEGTIDLNTGEMTDAWLDTW
ncbi:hypothetical protein [Enterococcus sp. C76]|uniref:hypothetical protein n=1 Tax=Enterococcus sp. C76 TaxID=3231334 RepID=UPI0034A05FF2